MEDAAVTDIGTRLKHARERRKLSLADISARTKIPVRALDAIEHNDFARLPAGLFRRAFIKAFAAEVGADGDALASQYQEAQQADEVDRAEVAMAVLAATRDEASRRSSWKGTATGAAVLLCVWIAPAVVGRVRHGGAAPPSIDRAIESVPTNTRGQSTAAGQSALPGTATPAVAESDPLPLRLEIRVARRCWVAVTADGKRVVYRVLARGESSVIDARDTIDLRLGDAGAVMYLINGALGRSLGASGAVVSVRITTANAHTLLADAPVGSEKAHEVRSEQRSKSEVESARGPG